MANNAERKLADSSELVELDAPMLVRAGRIAFAIRRAADAQAIEVREDYYHNGKRLADVWPSRGKKYQYLTRGIVLGGLILTPLEELVIGRAVGLEVHHANGAIDSDRSSMHFDHALHLAFEVDTSMSSRHTVITALPGGNMNVMDLGSTTGTFLQKLL